MDGRGFRVEAFIFLICGCRLSCVHPVHYHADHVAALQSDTVALDPTLTGTGEQYASARISSSAPRTPHIIPRGVQPVVPDARAAAGWA